MSCHIVRWVLRVLPLWIVGLFAPAACAQPILWGTAAANGSFPNGRLLRIDYATGMVQATFNGPSGVMIGDGFTGVAVRPSNGQVFVADGLGSNFVYRFDPVIGAVLGNIGAPTGGSTIDGLEFLGNELYAHRIGDSRIVRMDPDTGAVLGTLPMPGVGFGQGGLTIALDILFSHGSTGSTTIARRDLNTGAILSEFATPNNEAVLGLAADGTSIYAASSAGLIYRLNPLTGAVLDSRNIGISLDGLGGPAPVPEPSAGLLILISLLVGCARRTPSLGKVVLAGARSARRLASATPHSS
jgi:outer membrane protein assembly factor BamB